MKDLKLEVFKTPLEKRRGLLNRKKIGVHELFLFPGVNTIHTHGMKFPIKVIFVDSKADIISIVLMKPGQEYKEPGAAAAIECHPFFNSANLHELKEKIIKTL
ncbi:MAG: DUF192 domain-containing protein [Candidatus Dojkabacteria bacterium]|nr:DUF192 domain-containing protein [Candidatus Dojkabacteria bacterium]